MTPTVGVGTILIADRPRSHNYSPSKLSLTPENGTSYGDSTVLHSIVRYMAQGGISSLWRQKSGDVLWIPRDRHDPERDATDSR